MVIICHNFYGGAKITSEFAFSQYSVAAAELGIYGVELTNSLLTIQSNFAAIYFANESIHKGINGYLSAKGFDFPVTGLAGQVGFLLGNF